MDLSSSQYISTYMPRLDNPADSPQPYQIGCFAWTSMALQTSSVRTVFTAIPALQEHGLPMAYIFLCVRFIWIVHSVATAVADKYIRIPNSASGATLDTGGRLNLSRQGLSPCKMHQTWLDALTPQTASVATWRSFCVCKRCDELWSPLLCLIVFPFHSSEPFTFRVKKWNMLLLVTNLL